MSVRLRALCSHCFQTFSSLGGAPRELYLIYVTKVLESYSYFSLSLLYTIYLTDELGVDDVAAGASYGMWGVLTVLWGVLLGPLIDYLGVRGSLLVSFAMSTVVRMMLTTTTSLPLVYILLYTTVPAATSLGVPVMTIGVKRFTTIANRSVAFGLFYALMNVAALANGLLMDFLRVTLCHGFGIDSLGPDHWLNNGNRLIMATGAISSILGFVIASTLREVPAKDGADLDSAAGGSTLCTEDSGSTSPIAARWDDDVFHQPRSPWSVAVWRAQVHSAVASLRELAGYSKFLKYLVFALFLTNLRQAFRYLDAMLPKYMERAFGCATRVGAVYSINPAMIIILVPLVSAVTSGQRHFKMIHYGGYLSALSPFWLVALQSELGAIMFVVTLSLGEAIWSPRWYDLTMEVAPVGKEGLFTALASAPLFLAKLPTGFLSGVLLQAFCPASVNCSKETAANCVGPGHSAAPPHPPPAPADMVPCDGQKLWLVVGLMTIMSPLLTTCFSGWLGSMESDSPTDPYQQMQDDPSACQSATTSMGGGHDQSLSGGLPDGELSPMLLNVCVEEVLVAGVHFPGRMTSPAPQR